MKKIHSMCIEKNVESGEMSELEAKANSVEDNGVASGGAADSKP